MMIYFTLFYFILFFSFFGSHEHTHSHSRRVIYLLIVNTSVLYVIHTRLRHFISIGCLCHCCCCCWKLDVNVFTIQIVTIWPMSFRTHAAVDIVEIELIWSSAKPKIVYSTTNMLLNSIFENITNTSLFEISLLFWPICVKYIYFERYI